MSACRMGWNGMGWVAATYPQPTNLPGAGGDTTTPSPSPSPLNVMRLPDREVSKRGNIQEEKIREPRMKKKSTPSGERGELNNDDNRQPRSNNSNGCPTILLTLMLCGMLRIGETIASLGSQWKVMHHNPPRSIAAKPCRDGHLFPRPVKPVQPTLPSGSIPTVEFVRLLLGAAACPTKPSDPQGQTLASQVDRSNQSSSIRAKTEMARPDSGKWAMPTNNGPDWHSSIAWSLFFLPSSDATDRSPANANLMAQPLRFAFH
ncbi:hypothetical protein BO78DRAFT_45552 [Aspergillus sclerotiicarbonarius CBS 121057]|uniref:Uncharacterized protein n=1 Tax=Aspergillus sclerotiicarbonarius (strain CBS 121057 / IBT 28362) TaxID=1448318 RepID=A0A319E9G4_ASPSB|nr:hypothetical protein BO78DRAFT_45552 [Aspergillus sclerotiicarbonarius CBS 121057]